ncbi:MAG: VWA domain-containing protein [Crocinitomicaceae bacterium]|nr:VWA domain-containing protein [Crocinitomicaceae bacterium]
MNDVRFDIDFWNYFFAEKEALWLLILLAPLIAYYIYKTLDPKRSVQLSSNENLVTDDLFSKLLPYLKYLNFAFLIFGLAFLIIAMARPQDKSDAEEYSKKFQEGIDIMITMDVSGSMLAEDFTPNRLEAGKQVGLDFVDSRPNDRIGLVVYEGEAYTKCPLTNDHSVLRKLFSEVRTGLVDGGTAIGTGLAVAVNNLRDTTRKSRVIILLTDGVDSGGEIDPKTAASIAKSFGVRVYTIGVGTNGFAVMPVHTPLGLVKQRVQVEIDEDILKYIANSTGGKYFRATDENKLSQIFQEIDEMEKSRTKVLEYKVDPPERFHGFLLYGIILLLANFTLTNTLFRSIK